MDTAAAKKQCEAATDGWEIGQERGNPPYQIVSHGAVVADFGAGWKDIFFAVNARTDLPAALEALEEAQGKLEAVKEVKAQLGHYAKWGDLGARPRFICAVIAGELSCILRGTKEGE